MRKIAYFVFNLFLIILFCQPAQSRQQSEGQLLFSFGVIADVQYADAEQAGKRNYRGTIKTLERTVPRLNEHELSFVASLGDLIDRDYESFAKPIALMDQSKSKVHYVLGNHEFSVEDHLKKTVPRLLNNPKRYYSFNVDNFRMLILNGMEESMDAYPEGSRKYKTGEERYQQLKSSGANNARTYNGGLGKKQRNWLARELRKAERKDEKVILFCHFPLLPENGLQLWDNREVLRRIEDSDAVVAYFSGHHHAGNYVLEDGVHHLTFKGMVESAAEVSGGIVEVYEDKLIIHGLGEQEDQILEF